MGGIVELPPIKLRSVSAHPGLRKLSPDLISKAKDETATQVTRIGLTFLGTTAFCLLSLLSPDSALLGGNERINVPLAGPVSFFWFMLVGPAVLIALRAYLQIYVEHSDRLDRLARSVPLMRAPILVPLKNPLIRVVSALTFYVVLPAAMMLFAWKAAVFPRWGSALGGVAVAVIASHVMLPLVRFSWTKRALASAAAGILAVGIMLGLKHPLHRPFYLLHANLSGQWLSGENLREANVNFANLSGADLGDANLIGAYLDFANLSGANLIGAKLISAHLFHANLSGADLSGADLSGAADLSMAKLIGAHLFHANLSGADLHSANLCGAHLLIGNLSGADLSGVDLSGVDLSIAYLGSADLSSAKGLTQTQLDKACGNEETKLPERPERLTIEQHICVFRPERCKPELENK